MQIGADVDEARKAIAELREAMESAKEKQKTANADVKRLEKDMNDFKNNKEGKIEELKVGGEIHPVGYMSDATSAGRCQQTEGCIAEAFSCGQDPTSRIADSHSRTRYALSLQDCYAVIHRSSSTV